MRPTDADRLSAIEAHATRVERYRKGTLSADEFRSMRLSYGLYYQLDHTSHMQRVKLPGGLLTDDQALVIAELADKYARSVIHVTTRQDIQFHWIGIENVIPIYERLHSVGITTRGACSDGVRNVTGCVHAGILPDEPFDVTPYVLAIHEYFLFHPLNLTLPRKFKISFSACAYDCVQGAVNDIAYFPHLRDGKRGFAVHAGGGLGSQPFLAKPIYDFVPAEDTLIIAEAIVRVQHRHGERKNRKKARMKYVVQRMGLEKFKAEVDRVVAQVQAEMGDSLREELHEILGGYKPKQPKHAPSPMPQTSDARFAHWLRTNTFEQKQPGYFGVTVQLPLGDLTSTQMRDLVRLTQEHGASEMRAANDQNILVPWVSGSRLQAFYDGLWAMDLAAPNALHISDVVACPGADYCSLAVNRSMGVAEAIREHLLRTNGHVEELGVFRIRISGCPNSCGQHHVADIGLTGLSLKGDDGQDHPYYSMLLGSRLGEDGAAVGRRVSGRFPMETVPQAITALAEFYRSERLSGEAFVDFVARVGIDRLGNVARAAAGAVR